MWGGSKVYKKRFVVNLHCVTTEAHFQKWRTSYASAIPNDVHVKLAEPLTDDVPRMDPSNPNAKKVFCVMECASRQCTPNV